MVTLVGKGFVVVVDNSEVGVIGFRPGAVEPWGSPIADILNDDIVDGADGILPRISVIQNVIKAAVLSWRGKKEIN